MRQEAEEKKQKKQSGEERTESGVTGGKNGEKIKCEHQQDHCGLSGDTSIHHKQVLHSPSVLETQQESELSLSLHVPAALCFFGFFTTLSSYQPFFLTVDRMVQIDRWKRARRRRTKAFSHTHMQLHCQSCTGGCSCSFSELLTKTLTSSEIAGVLFKHRLLCRATSPLRGSFLPQQQAAGKQNITHFCHQLWMLQMPPLKRSNTFHSLSVSHTNWETGF